MVAGDGSAAPGAQQPLRLGTRGSTLALVQTEWVRALLPRAFPSLAVEIRVIQSLGDRVRDQPLESLGAEGIFTHALESALLAGTIDVAVHSAKDLPGRLGEGLVIAAVPTREDARDCLLTLDGRGLDDLPHGARLGTGSPRRRAQLLHRRPDLRFVPLRGNVDTRRRAVLDGRIDGAILAAAGLKRLGLLDGHVALLPLQVCLPQAGQGALALEMRAVDAARRALLGAIDDAASAACLRAERAVLAGLAAGCQAPVAAHGAFGEEGLLLVRGLVADARGTHCLTAEEKGTAEEAEAAGERVAHSLRRQGAAELLARAREESR